MTLSLLLPYIVGLTPSVLIFCIFSVVASKLLKCSLYFSASSSDIAITANSAVCKTLSFVILAISFTSTKLIINYHTILFDLFIITYITILYDLYLFLILFVNFVPIY